MNQILNVRGIKCTFIDMWDPSVRLVHKIAKSDSWLCHVCASICMKHLSSHWMDFHEILCLSIFLKIGEKIEVSFKPASITVLCMKTYVHL